MTMAALIKPSDTLTATSPQGITATLERRQTSGGFNTAPRPTWCRGGMMWTVEISGSPGGRSDGEYAFKRKIDAVAAYDYAATTWDGRGDLPDQCHCHLIHTGHPLQDTWAGEF